VRERPPQRGLSVFIAVVEHKSIGGSSCLRLRLLPAPLTANTCKDGLLGSMYRAKYTTTGTYAGKTNVRIDLITDGLTASP
jgi:hypothetical protein